MSNPVVNLIIFFVLLVLGYYVFKPKNGWFWIFRNNLKVNQKIVSEDILKLLFRYVDSGENASINSLTRSLKFSDDVIIDAIKELSIKELIEQDGEVLSLTNEGRDYALKIIRVHRLWEKYLAEKTGFDKLEWHDRAEEMEHKLSHEETNLLATELGQPMYDPHGDPIPTHKGRVAELKGELLSKLPVNTIGRITHIEDEPDVIYKQILAENIHIGSQIRVVESNTKRIVFYSEGEEFVLAPVVAANLTVEVLENEIHEEKDMIRLSSLKEEETATIVGISKECRGDARRRLLDLGFVKGTTIKINMVSPLKNPKAYSVKGTSIALRDKQASRILIKKD
ncbi:MAG: FeoA domain-containing protein [Bacteroidia bacterium]|nr:FeoA domain-containing protein [Bacteroidia bacterium]